MVRNDDFVFAVSLAHLPFHPVALHGVFKTSLGHADQKLGLDAHGRLLIVARLPIKIVRQGHINHPKGESQHGLALASLKEGVYSLLAIYTFLLAKCGG